MGIIKKYTLVYVLKQINYAINVTERRKIWIHFTIQEGDI